LLFCRRSLIRRPVRRARGSVGSGLECGLR
jgi:hypothetical protein